MNRFLLFLSLFTIQIAYSQEPMTVIRCTAPELQDPIHNIYVDKNNKKWVGSNNRLFQVHAIDYATIEPLNPGEDCLLNYPNGNADIRWSKQEMSKIIGDVNITAAYYDTKLRELWIGTAASGIIRMTVKPGLKKTGTINNKNSKLKSNTIKAINKAPDGRFWIGSDEGVLVGTPDKWTLKEKYLSIEAVSINRGNIWILADDSIWKVEEKDELYPINIDDRMVEGSIKDIATDSRGRIWVASDIVSRYNYDADDSQVFGPAQYFTSQDVNYVAIDKDDALWVGTNDKGLFLIEKASAITVTLLVEQGISCDAQSKDGALKVRVTGGQPPYYYDWEGDLRGERPTGLAAGTYQVTVTDDKGKTKTASVEIPDPRFTVVAVQKEIESGPGAGDAVAVANIEGGGLPDFKYKWDNGETTAKAIKLTEGDHTVTVTDANGCTAVGTINIGRKILPLAVNLSVEKENKCAEDNIAAIQTTIQGGKAPYKYQWNNSSANGENPQNLPSGNYQVTVSDASGLTSVATIDIPTITTLQANAKVEQSATTNNADGKATVKVSGGTSPYSFKWDTGESAATATKLAAGSHTVTVTDKNGCETTATISITEDILPLVVEIEQTAKIDCAGTSNAAAVAAVTGGKPPYNFKWNSEKFNGTEGNNLSVGVYEITVSDATGSTATRSIEIKSPAPLTLTATVQQSATVGNADGKATVKASGGTGSYSYKWDNGDADKTTKTLSAGSHAVTVMDAAGCQQTATVEVTENILALSVDAEITNEIKCHGDESGAISTSINGGKGPFTYAWSASGQTGASIKNLQAATYQLTVTDMTGTTATTQVIINQPQKLEVSVSVRQPASTGNSDGKAVANVKGGDGKYTFKWDNNETNGNAEKLSPGDHTVTVTDGNGCTITATVSITENVLPLTVNINETNDIKCYNAKTGGLELTVSGGKEPFSYQWNNAQLKGDKLNNIDAGDYVVTVTDAKGQSATASLTINQPTELTARITSFDYTSDATTADGEAKVAANGGAGNYLYKWDNGEDDENARKLAIGMRQVTVTDANGCEAMASVEIKKKIIPELRKGRLAMGQVIRLNELYFDADSTSLNADAMPILDEITYFLEQNPTINIEIAGHTNGVPPHEYCDKLSTERATSIAQYIYKNGITESRVIPKGYGKRKPIASNKTADGRKRNQRVELKILSL